MGLISRPKPKSDLLEYQVRMSGECPYCHERVRTSRDHIFPQFLGGQSKIRICKPCNDKFGHSFEGPVSKTFAPLQIFLRACGLRFPTGAKWKRAYKDNATALQFDLDENLEAIPPAPVILRDENEKICGAIFPDKKSAEECSRSLRKKGLAKKVRIEKKVNEGLRPQLNSFDIQIDTNLRKLAIKMSAGLADKLNFNGTILDTNSRQFLVGTNYGHIPVRVAYLSYDLLDPKCPPLSHVIYVEGNQKNQRSYGVVRFFNTFQLYCILSNHYSAASFASLGVLDVSTKKETFSEIAPLELDEAPPSVPANEKNEGIRRWARRMTSQITTLLGPNRGSVRMDPS